MESCTIINILNVLNISNNPKHLFKNIIMFVLSFYLLFFLPVSLSCKIITKARYAKMLGCPNLFKNICSYLKNNAYI